MQKQKKQFMIAVLVLAALALCYLGLRYYNTKQEEKEQEEEEAATIKVTDDSSEDVTEWSFQYNGTTLSFAKNDSDEWYDTADESVKLDQDLISGLLTNITSVIAEDEVTDYEALSDYGMDAPEVVVSYTTEEGSKTLSFGMTNEVLSKDYMMLEGNDTIYLVGTTVKSAFEITVDDLIATEEDTEENAVTDTES